MAVIALPNLDCAGTPYGIAQSLSDRAARALYAVKLGDRALFAALVAELTADARASSAPGKSYVLQVPPLTLSYVIEARGPCIEVGPGGPDHAERLPLTEQELYDLLRIPPRTSAADYSKCFAGITGDLKHRKKFAHS